jgi:hypothetical protein
MTQSLGLQILTKVLGDQSRSTIRHQPGPIRQRCLFHTRSLTSRLDDLGEVSSTHGGLKSPGQDLPAKVIQDRDQIVPAPVLDQQIGRISTSFPKGTAILEKPKAAASLQVRKISWVDR